ncbi:MAG: GDSL-type esterase/lipase family protein [Lentisphaeraceae bacterium]|nr:GDSL-type esterase/lipase family protein [Lentisphaeraceae bacterium]
MRYLAWIVPFLLVFSSNAEKIRIACIGDSITFGSGINDRTLTYPSQLQKLLGPNYEVRNFGNPGRGIIKSSKRGNGMRGFIFQKEHKDALGFNPNIVICNLGINDIDACRAGKWSDFTPDYIELINAYKSLPTKPKIFIWTKLAPILEGHRCFNWTEPFSMRLHLNDIVTQTDTFPIDIFSAMVGRPGLFSKDAIHPNATGAKVIADETFEVLKPYLNNDFGGLKLPYVFSDNMVLQRNKPINIFGSANLGQKVNVEFLGKSEDTITSKHGKWSVSFPQQKEGGPYTIKITAEQSIQLKNVMIGEVWLAAGQSNMRWTLAQSASGKSEIPKSTNKNFRLLNRHKTINTKLKWNKSEIAKSNIEKIYSGSWEESSPQSSKNFSGVAYYFGKNLQKELNIPIGIINVPIGGTICEAFTSEESLLQNNILLPQIASNKSWMENESISQWCRQRAALNLTEWRNNPSSKMPGHHFQPGYLFEAAIKPITNFNIRGVIWYQGESNATKADNKTAMPKEYCKAGLETLIADWRKQWNEELPFYFVQLPGLNRNWMEFREVQLKVFQETKNTGLVVTTDVGHPTNVHPNLKQPVGERLSLWALAKCYDKNIEYCGPIIKSAILKGESITLTFLHSKDGLFNKSGNALQGFELADKQGVFKPVKAHISGETVIIETKGTQVRYNWTPNPSGRLANKAGLQATPFKIDIQEQP